MAHYINIMALSSDRITFHMPTANTAVYQIDGRKGKPRVCGLDIFFQGWDGIHAVVLPAYPDETKIYAMPFYCQKMFFSNHGMPILVRIAHN